MQGGARFIQVRAKQLPSAAFLQLIEAVLRVARPAGATVIVNDRVDLAMMSGADGAHVGQDDLPPAEARALLGPGAVIGCSTHTREQVERALTQPVSYIAVGPVFGTQTKDTGYGAVGLEFVRAAAALSQETWRPPSLGAEAPGAKAAGGRIPIVAIGGITLETAPAVLAAGAASVAVIADLLSGDPAERVRRYGSL